MEEDGLVKFNCQWKKIKPEKVKQIRALNNSRKKLYEKKLIGAYDNGIGYGNISARTAMNQFVITGSGTGDLEKLTRKHYTKVLNYDFDKNSLICKGPIKASSESLTHAAIYESDPSVNAVVHVHDFKLWSKMIICMQEIPKTSKEVQYGTPEMAYEMMRLFKETDVKDKKIIVMAGHEEGIITFGKDLKEATDLILELYSLL